MAEKIHPSSKEDNIDENAPTRPIDAKILRRAILKINCYLIPIVGMNIGNTRITGLTNSLHMSTKQFSIALTITYVPYILMEIPMNLLMKCLGANVTLPVMVILWGVICACQGIGCGLFPGIALLLSNFYKRHAMHFHFAMIYSLSLLASAFSDLLAYGIQNLNGKHRIAGWQWIFIVVFHLSLPFGLTTLFFVPASPKSINLLTEEEHEAYCHDLADDWSGDADTNGTYREVFSWSKSQILPYTCSFIFSIVSAYFCDKYKNRSVMATVCALIITAGYAIFLSSDNKNTNYGALCLQSSYAVPHYCCVTAIAISYIGTNAGGILSTWLFTDSPCFQKATCINLAFPLEMAAFSMGILVYFRFHNAEKREVQWLLWMHGDGTGVGGWDSSTERKRLGDRHPHFAFTM
ncbi:major facilitator superfamily domain-containing protein [Lactarius quietus]|nr:major facilitator superfamily domain-containing protein [Lactarius quietus]